ncbi:hypothetical protein EEI76_19230 [Enterobacter cloacae]|nr:hypothetical protein EEI76_19230 [Enterobacter cloacae]
MGNLTVIRVDDKIRAPRNSAFPSDEFGLTSPMADQRNRRQAERKKRSPSAHRLISEMGHHRGRLKDELLTLCEIGDTLSDLQNVHAMPIGLQQMWGEPPDGR